jgi:hypothetical protein
MNFKKLKQLSNDIDLLEQSGKYSAAEVLHKKFIKEAQVDNNVQNYQPRPGTVNQRIEYQGKGNAFERGDNFAKSERGGVGTLYNFRGLPEEKVPVNVETSPGNMGIRMKPKNNIGNPYATRPADPFRNIPGYNELSRLTNDASLIRDFVDANGTSTDAGKAIYDALMASQSGRSKAPAPTATPGFSLSQTPKPNNVNNNRFLNTQKLDFNTTPTATPTVTPTVTSTVTPTVTPKVTPTVTPTGTENTNYIAPNAIVKTNLAQDTADENANQLLQESKAKMQERIKYYDNKIQEMNKQNNTQVKENMRNTLKTYISNNHSTGILDTNSYSRFMNALGKNSGYS